MIPLLSTAYLPPIEYMAVLSHCQNATVEHFETFPKQTYRNRATILTGNGTQQLTVPVVKNNHTCTADVRIDHSQRWQDIHIRTLNAAYNASPYYQYYAHELAVILRQPTTFLVDLNQNLLDWLLKKIKLSTNITHTAEWEKEPAGFVDLRNSITPKRPSSIITTYKPYYQVFSDRIDFQPNLSAIDLLANLGPESKDYLEALSPQCFT
ncbi:MAG: WbqC family protein [Bacteroidales bacterium]|nr:WbqC family protein [Bacteroidales bacterium]